MPEGDSVVRTARLLDRALAGQVLTGCLFRVPALATRDLTGGRVLGTGTHGKHLFTRVEDAGTELVVHSHLGMDGAWRSQPSPHHPRALHHEVRAMLTTAEHRVLGTSLKTLDLLSPAEVAALRQRLGPDLLAAEFEPLLPDALARAEALPGGLDVASVLLDQQVAAGMGTVLVSEVLFLLGTSPASSVGRVDLARVYRKARLVLQHSVRTGQRATTGSLRRGQSLWVHGREGQPCRRCGTPIRRDLHSPHQRSVWWCPQCQPPP